MTFMPLSLPAFTGGGFVAEHLAQAQFTTRINNRQPVDNLRKINTKFKKVYFFTDVRECKNCKIEHQWWYKGNKVSSVDAVAKYPRYRWWTNKSLTDDYLGDWTVKVLLDGKEVYTKTITYYAPSHIQMQQAPVQQRVMIQETGECEIQLRHFSGELRDNPDDPYIKFMLDKWDKRCSGK